jgi:hypothetical protein
MDRAGLGYGRIADFPERGAARRPGIRDLEVHFTPRNYLDCFG